jgi:DNA-binding NtrC family response regulator
MLRGSQRSADPRRSTLSLVSTIAETLPVAREPRLLRERFEEGLRGLVHARQVELRDGPPTPHVADGVSLDVGVGPYALGSLNAVFAAGEEPDAWDSQQLQFARHLGAFVLILERACRAGVLGGLRSRSDGAAPLIGRSLAMQAVRDRIGRVAATDFTILIEGESGSGKELVARQIHDLSARRNGPFVAVNCAAIVETLLEAELFGIEERTATGVRGRRGKFEHAHEGTLFLDEVADLSTAAQAKLLRVIQEMSVERVGATGGRSIDVRLIAATNQKLSDLVARDRFRLDLFYRLHGVEIVVPPLRQRPEDILELTEYFLARHRAYRPLQVSRAAADALTAYAWPGNVRELQRVMERAIALADSEELRLDDLPPSLLDGYGENLLPSFHRHETMRVWASRYVRLVMDRCENNKRRACRELDISYHTLNAYLRFQPDPLPRSAADQRIAHAGPTRAASSASPAVGEARETAGTNRSKLTSATTALMVQSQSGRVPW